MGQSSTEVQNITPINPIDGLLATIAIAIDTWEKKNSSEKITQTVHIKLDKAADEVLYKMLGFRSDSWGRWEIDNCNGRNGESAIGDYLKKTQETAVKDWFDAIANHEISPALKKKLQKVMKDEYEERMLRHARQLAAHKADEDLNTLLDTICVSNHLSNYMKTLALINPSKKD